MTEPSIAEIVRMPGKPAEERERLARMFSGHEWIAAAIREGAP